MNYLIDILLAFAVATIPASFSYFLDYCLGKPGSEQPNNSEIFSFYTLLISEWTLGRNKATKIMTNFIEMMRDKDQRHDAQRLYFETVVAEAQKRFTFQKMFGMCIFCTGFWIALISTFFFVNVFPPSTMNPNFYFLLIPIFSHLILRKL